MADRIAALFGLRPDAPHLQEALTHPSFANEVKTVPHYQRLEFLGDAVLGLCTTELLWRRYPGADEGTLTRMRARLVNADALSRWAVEHGLADALLLGRGAEAGGLRRSKNVLCDVVEALIGAAYLDEGMEAAQAACSAIIEPLIRTFEDDDGRDPKSELQERVQKDGGELPVYDVAESGGPNHAPWYIVQVSVGGRVVGTGRGGSKRSAESAAARSALSALEGDGGGLEVGPTDAAASSEAGEGQ